MKGYLLISLDERIFETLPEYRPRIHRGCSPTLFWLAIMSPDWEGDVRTINKEQFRDWLATIESEENESLTADTLREYCDEQDGTYPEGVCTGYLLGYVEGFGMERAIDFCVYDEEFSASQPDRTSFPKFHGGQSKILEEVPWLDPRRSVAGRFSLLGTLVGSPRVR